MLSLKNKFLSNIVFSLIFIISISYSTFLYIKGDNIEVSNNSMTPLDVFIYSPQNDEIGISIVSSLAARQDSFMIIIEQLFSNNKNIEFKSAQNKLRGYSFRSATYFFNYLGDISELVIDHEGFKEYLWNNYSTQFQLEIDSKKQYSEIQKQNYKKIIKDVNQAEIINNFTDYDIQKCKFNLVLDNFNPSSFDSRAKELDYLCELEVSKNYQINKESFFELLQYKVFQKESVNIHSSKKYNVNYIIFSFLAFLSFVILILLNFKRNFK